MVAHLKNSINASSTDSNDITYKITVIFILLALEDYVI